MCPLKGEGRSYTLMKGEDLLHKGPEHVFCHHPLTSPLSLLSLEGTMMLLLQLLRKQETLPPFAPCWAYTKWTEPQSPQGFPSSFLSRGCASPGRNDTQCVCVWEHGGCKLLVRAFRILLMGLARSWSRIVSKAPEGKSLQMSDSRFALWRMYLSCQELNFRRR